MRRSGRTRVLALLGQPVAHSVSPAMHNAAIQALGLDAVYVPLPIAADAVPVVMETLAAAGGGGNITVPYKGIAAAAIGHHHGAVPDACNTFWQDPDGTLAGDNTDVEGIAHALAHLGGGAGDAWLCLGTGGTARALLAAARRAGAAVAVRSRDPRRAAAFEAIRDAAGVAAVPAGTPVTAVINCTPLGLQPEDPPPLAIAELPAGAGVLDLVYTPGETRWVRAARAAGHVAADGREVLVRQGIAAFRRWFPEVEPPGEVMRAAVHRALG